MDSDSDWQTGGWQMDGCSQSSSGECTGSDTLKAYTVWSLSENLKVPGQSPRLQNSTERWAGQICHRQEMTGPGKFEERKGKISVVDQKVPWSKLWPIFPLDLNLTLYWIILLYGSSVTRQGNLLERRETVSRFWKTRKPELSLLDVLKMPHVKEESSSFSLSSLVMTSVLSGVEKAKLPIGRSQGTGLI